MGEGPNPYAPPVAEVRDAPPAEEHVLAGRGARLLAAIIDTIVLIAVLAVLSFLLPWPIFARTTTVPAALTALAAFLLIQGWPLVQRGQTIGKMVLGLRIVRPDGSAVSPGRMLGGRYGPGLLLGLVPVINSIWGLVDSLLIFRESRRCLHDQIADTIVVKV